MNIYIDIFTAYDSNKKYNKIYNEYLIKNTINKIYNNNINLFYNILSLISNFLKIKLTIDDLLNNTNNIYELNQFENLIFYNYLYIVNTNLIIGVNNELYIIKNKNYLYIYKYKSFNLNHFNISKYNLDNTIKSNSNYDTKKNINIDNIYFYQFLINNKLKCFCSIKKKFNIINKKLSVFNNDNLICLYYINKYNYKYNIYILRIYKKYRLQNNTQFMHYIIFNFNIIINFI